MVADHNSPLPAQLCQTALSEVVMEDRRLRLKAQLSLVTNGQNSHFILRNHKSIQCDVTSLSV